MFKEKRKSIQRQQALKPATVQPKVPAIPVQRARPQLEAWPAEFNKATAIQRQSAAPALQAAALHTQEVSRLSNQAAAVQRQIAELPILPAGATEAALQRQATSTQQTPPPLKPQSPADWVTVMRFQAEQAEGRWMQSRESMQFTALQRQVAQILTQNYVRDRQPAIQRQQEYAQHVATLQRHPLSGTVASVFMRNVPASERPTLQRAVDELVQQEALQRQQDEQALQLHSLQRQLAELNAEATQPVFERIQARRGSGNPLPEAVQRHLEHGLNHDLSNVRIHDDAEADKMAKGVNAIAFTTGSDIFFQSGKFNPNTQSGLELLAHEVTHTVQQSKGQVGKGVDPDSGLETEARTMGRTLAKKKFNPGPLKAKALPKLSAQTATTAVQRQTATASKATQTPDQYVQGFKAKLKQAALQVLKQNEDRLVQRQAALKDTNPSNPAWATMHQMAQKNAQIEAKWQPLANQISKEVGNYGNTAARAFTVAQAQLRLGDRRDDLIGGIHNAWSNSNPYPTNQAGAAAHEQKFLKLMTPLLGTFDRIGRVEDARDFLYAQYPEVGLLSKQMGGKVLAKTPNTAAQNKQLNAQLTEAFKRTRTAIAELRSKIQAGKMPIEHMDILLTQVMQQEGIQPTATSAKSKAVIDWLNSQKREELWVNIGLAVATLGLTIASFFAPGSILLVLAAGGAGAAMSSRNYLSAKSQQGVSNTQAMGGQKMTNVTPEAAQAGVVLAQVDALMAGAGLATAVGAGVRRLGPLAQDAEQLARGGNYKWATAGEVNNGVPIRRRVNTPAVVPEDLKPLSKVGGKVPQPAGSIQGIERQVLLARYCDNWSVVQPKIRTKAGPDNLPEGYLYLETKLSNGKTLKMAFQPSSRTGSVPKLKADEAGNWQPDGLSFNKDGTLNRDYRVAQKSEYDKTNPPPMKGADLTNNHHLWPDNFMRRNAFFQEGFKRGLIPPDREPNMLTLANSPEALAKLRAKFPNITFNDIMHATSHSEYDNLVGIWYRKEYPNLLKEVGAKPGTSPEDLKDAQILRMMERFDEILRDKFNNPPQDLLDILEDGFLTQNNSGDEVRGA